MPTTLTEGSLTFTFDDDAVKFDENAFYRGPFQLCPGGKGVDFLAASPDGGVLLMEVKDCTDNERDNLWRLSPDNRSADIKPKGRDTEGRDSLDIETAEKVCYSLLCLYGAWRDRSGSDGTQDFSHYWEQCADPSIRRDRKKLRVILFLEGEFGSGGKGSSDRRKKSVTRQDTAHLLRLRESISQKLRWLNCTVEVVNSRTFSQIPEYPGFTVRKANYPGKR